MTVAEFREKCAAYAMEQVNSQREQFKRLGLLADFENPYITLQPEYEAAQIRLFGSMAEKGYIYKGKKPVYWSPSSESALAEAEIEYYDKKSPAIYVAFPSLTEKVYSKRQIISSSGRRHRGQSQRTWGLPSAMS